MIHDNPEVESRLRRRDIKVRLVNWALETRDPRLLQASQVLEAELEGRALEILRTVNGPWKKRAAQFRREICEAYPSLLLTPESEP